jgi:hypothetical protein
MIACKNCGQIVELNFCPHCGQHIRVDRLSLPGLLRDLPHAIFHVDKGFLYNFLQFFKKPGKSIVNYLEGKRKPFFHPATYLIIALILNYLVVKIYDLHFYDEHELITMEPLKAQAIRDYDGLQWWFLEHTYIYILLAIPLSSLFLFILLKFLRQTYNLAESAVVVLFTIAQGVLIQTILYFFFGWTGSGAFNRTLEMVNMPILILYATLVIFQLSVSYRKKLLRITLSLFAGVGLAAVWIASAYVLYYVLE